MRREQEGVLVTLTFSGYGELSSYLQDQKQVEELVHLLHQEENREDFVYIINCHNSTLSSSIWESMKNEHHFLGELLRETERFANIDTILHPLRHSSATRGIEAFSETEKQEILKEAERIIIQELLAERGGRT
jgi:hypothetical protein